MSRRALAAAGLSAAVLGGAVIAATGVAATTATVRDPSDTSAVLDLQSASLTPSASSR